LLKYPVGSSNRDKRVVATKKHGFFAAERSVVEEVWHHTGLGEGRRHPLAYLMEAADDIAYSVIDVEDAVKKGLVSFADVMARLRAQLENQPGDGDEVVANVLQKSEEDHREYRELGLSPAELNELATQKFRVHAMTAMVQACVDAFIERYDAGASAAGMDKDLISASAVAGLCGALKDFALRHAYRHRSVLELELQGRRTIHYLMEVLWRAIDRAGEGEPELRYLYSRISENYRRVYADNEELPELYRKLLLLTDMIAGMTDGFALSLAAELRELKL
jgi:dGTPase